MIIAERVGMVGIGGVVTRLALLHHAVAARRRQARVGAVVGVVRVAVVADLGARHPAVAAAGPADPYVRHVGHDRRVLDRPRPLAGLQLECPDQAIGAGRLGVGGDHGQAVGAAPGGQRALRVGDADDQAAAGEVERGVDREHQVVVVNDPVPGARRGGVARDGGEVGRSRQIIGFERILWIGRVCERDVDLRSEADVIRVRGAHLDVERDGVARNQLEWLDVAVDEPHRRLPQVVLGASRAGERDGSRGFPAAVVDRDHVGRRPVRSEHGGDRHHQHGAESPDSKLRSHGSFHELSSGTGGCKRCCVRQTRYGMAETTFHDAVAACWPRG